MHNKGMMVALAALTLVGCKKAEAPKPTAAEMVVETSSGCTVEKLSNIENYVGGYESPCALGKPVSGGSGRLVLSDIDLTPGRNLDAVLKDARTANVRVTTARGETTLFVDEDVPTQFGGPFNEWRRYVLATKAGKITGIRACENYESGKYRNRLNRSAVAAYGLPSSLSSDSANVYMRWQGGANLHVSGSPNFSILELGDEPPSFAARDNRWQRQLFDELVREEDNHPGDTEAARTKVALKHCMTTQELASRMISELEAGAQPDDGEL